MSDIVALASELEVERVWPSKGLTDEQVGMTFRRLGLDTLQYRVQADDGGNHMARDEVEALVRRYLNSGIPLALGTPNHLSAVIGAGYDDNGLYVVQCDDQHGVYDRRSIDLDGTVNEQGPWEVVMVPLPGRIYVPFEQIEPEVRSSIQKLVYDHDLDAELAGTRRADIRISEPPTACVLMARLVFSQLERAKSGMLGVRAEWHPPWREGGTHNGNARRAHRAVGGGLGRGCGRGGRDGVVRGRRRPSGGCAGGFGGGGGGVRGA